MELAQLAQLAERILECAAAAGLTFPCDMTKLNVALLERGVSYAALGFDRCKDMFAALEPWFELTHPYPSALFVSRRDAGPTLAPAEFGSASSPGNALFAEYFALPLIEKSRCVRELHRDVYMKDRDMTAVVLNRLTQRDELTADGWQSLIAFAYARARGRGEARESRDGRHLRFPLELETQKREPIYALAVRNARAAREGAAPWVLKGVATRSSYYLGDVVREFD